MEEARIIKALLKLGEIEQMAMKLKADVAEIKKVLNERWQTERANQQEKQQ